MTCLALSWALLLGVLHAQEEPRIDVSAYEHDLAWRLRQPMIQGLDVSAPLQAWFEARKATSPAKQVALLSAGMESLKGELKPLPKGEPPAPPTGVTLKLLEVAKIPDMPSMRHAAGLDLKQVKCQIVEFEVDGLKQYGVVLAPRAAGKYPLILYMHGAAFGVPSYSLPWLAELAMQGYVIAAPALRGEPLFAMQELMDVGKAYTCEGQIENLDGEVQDALAIVDGAFRLPNVKPGEFAMIGHSFGAGVGLLLATRTEKMSCAISYDAWLVNPFRYYWDRLRGGANNWLSWEAYTEQPVADQLRGLMRRSTVHHAEKIQAPLLLFMGGAYNGSVFHESHDDLTAQLKKYDKTFRYEIIPGGGHNFVLYPKEAPAIAAYALQDAWLKRYHPPAAPTP